MSVSAKLVFGTVVLVGTMTYVAYLGASSSWQYYLTVDEYSADAEHFLGRRVRVSGRVAPGSLQVREDRGGATFVLLGSTGRLPTACPGPLPDNLAEDMEVVVEGRLERPGFLSGDKVLTRCASKYTAR